MVTEFLFQIFISKMTWADARLELLQPRGRDGLQKPTTDREREREREEREKLGTKVRPTDTRLPPVTNKMLLGSFGLFLLSLKYVSKIFYTFIQIPLSEISLLNNPKPFALP